MATEAADDLTVEPRFSIVFVQLSQHTLILTLAPDNRFEGLVKRLLQEPSRQLLEFWAGRAYHCSEERAMFHKIVVPVDGSEPSDAAVALAFQIAKENQAELIFVHAVELNKIVALAGPALDPSIAIDAASQVGTELLENVKKRADQAGLQASTELPEDECVSSVLEIDRQRRADLIIVGSHGRSGIPRALLGSVAEGILRRSPIPVLVCHAPRRPRREPDLAASSLHKTAEA